MGMAPPTLDGIVASHLAALRGEGAVPELLHSLFAATEGVMHASRGLLDALPYADTFSKVRRSLQPSQLRAGDRFSDALVAAIPRGKRSGHSQSNTNKDVPDERTLIPVSRIVFEATLVCEPDVLRRLLDEIDAIGAWRSKGFGRVEHWEIERLPGRSAAGLCTPDGTAARPVPLALAKALDIRGPVGMGRALTSYGYVLADAVPCVLPASLLVTAPNRPQGEVGSLSERSVAEHFKRCVGTEDAETWLNRAWPNAGGKATRPLTPNSVLLLAEGDCQLAGNNLVDGMRNLPLLLSAEGQPSIFRTGRALFRQLIAAPPRQPYMVVWKDSNRGLSLDGAVVGSGDIMSLTTAEAGSFIIDAALLRAAFDATAQMDYKQIMDLIRVGDTLNRGVDERSAERRFDEFEALGGSDAYEAIPARWSREWSVFKALIGTAPLQAEAADA